MGLSPGTRLGPYEIESALGTGGMSEVSPLLRPPSCSTWTSIVAAPSPAMISALTGSAFW
jgi:hypothetical protein